MNFALSLCTVIQVAPFRFEKGRKEEEDGSQESQMKTIKHSYPSALLCCATVLKKSDFSPPTAVFLPIFRTQFSTLCQALAKRLPGSKAVVFLP